MCVGRFVLNVQAFSPVLANCKVFCCKPAEYPAAFVGAHPLNFLRLMPNSAELNFDLSTRIMVLDAGMYILRLLAKNPAPETCITVQQSPLGRGSVDFFPAEGVTRNTLAMPGDCIVVRVKGSQAGLLVTEIHKKGTEHVQLMLDRITTGQELIETRARSVPVESGVGKVDATADGSGVKAAEGVTVAAGVKAAATAGAPAPVTASGRIETSFMVAKPAVVAEKTEAPAGVAGATEGAAAALESGANLAAFAPVGARVAGAAAAQAVSAVPAAVSAAPAAAAAQAAPHITHVGHVEYKGDVSVTDTWLGNPVSTHRLEGFALTWEDMPKGVNLAYSCRNGAGAEPHIGLNGQFVGTRRQAKPITAVAFVLSGPRAHEFELSGYVAFAGLPPFAIVPGQELSGPSGAEHLVALQLVITPKEPQVVPPASPWANSAAARTFRAA